MAGYVDVEGCFSVVVNRNPTCKSGYQLVPEFHVSQNGDRAQVLALIQARLGGAATSSPMGRRIARWSSWYDVARICSGG